MHRLIENCPTCGTPNDIAETTHKMANAARPRELITVEVECERCGHLVTRGPMDPMTIKRLRPNG